MNIGLTKCISLDPTKLVAFRVIKNCVYCTKFGETVQKDEIWDFRGKWFWKFWNVMWGLVPLRPFDQNSLSPPLNFFSSLITFLHFLSIQTLFWFVFLGDLHQAFGFWRVPTPSSTLCSSIAHSRGSLRYANKLPLHSTY